MKRTILIVSLMIAVGVAALGSSLVYAQTPEPEEAQNETGYGRGFGRGMMGRSVENRGWMRDSMLEAVAEKLGFTVEAIKTRLEGGERFSTIAAEKGLTYEEFRSLMTEVRAQGIEKALADGSITQEQAEWMLQRGAGMRRNGGQPGSFGCPYPAPAQP
ncbi:MAG: hypothetical protein U1B80_09100 [Anaerolineaceae bacterium]|nr:hypothetical protein [Anaerolineaceae bacterium]